MKKKIPALCSLTSVFLAFITTSPPSSKNSAQNLKGSVHVFSEYLPSHHFAFSAFTFVVSHLSSCTMIDTSACDSVVTPFVL